MRTLVATARSSVQGALIVGMLQSHGLDASMSGDYVADARPALDDREIRVWVPEDQAERARAVVRNAEGASDTDVEPNGVRRWLRRLLSGGNPRADR